jgi:hypothetical protein
MITITINTTIAIIDGLSDEPQSCQSHLSGITANVLLDMHIVESAKNLCNLSTSKLYSFIEIKMRYNIPKSL